MRQSLLLILVLVLVSTTAHAAVFVDYDESYRASANRTFGWMDTPETSIRDTDPLMHSRIVNAIEHYLSMSGATESDDPDVWVTYHGSSKENVSIDTSHFGYGYPSSWAWGYGGYGYGGMGTSTSTVRTYETGTLVVDVWDAKSNQLVWRGTMTEIMLTPNATKMEKRIDKALKKLVKKWEKIKAKNATE